MTLTEMAEITGISLSTVAREIARLESSELVVVESIGRAKRATPNWNSPLARPLQMLLAQTSGPLLELSNLHSVPGVQQVFLFGSWADRYNGHSGRYPNDVDVAVIGDTVDYLAVHQICAQTSRRLEQLSGGPALEINPIVVTIHDWEEPEQDSFLDRVKCGNLVPVEPRSTPATRASRNEEVALSR